MKSEKVSDRIHGQLQKIGKNKKLLCSFLKHPSVACVSDG